MPAKRWISSIPLRDLRKQIVRIPSLTRSASSSAPSERTERRAWVRSSSTGGFQIAIRRFARCHAFRLRGSGAATVRTPPCMKPGRRFRVTLRGDQVEKQVLHASANRKGRLKLEVPLGPSNPYQQYTVEAALAGTAVYETAVRIKRRR